MPDALIFFIVFVAFWLVRTFKVFLFWIYLWQLKEYHIGRFIDHFNTYKGKSLILNRLLGIKVLIVACFFYNPIVFLIFLFLVYLFECLAFFRKILLGRLIKPVLTAKASFLIFVLFLFEILVVGKVLSVVSYIDRAALLLLFVDILAPLIASFVVFLFQPLTFVLRNRTLNMARKKRKKFKDLIVVGITGSYGKTATKEFLYQILSHKFNVLKTEKHQNSEIGIARTVLDKLKPEHEIFIVEMGAYNVGGIKLLCDIAQPKIGVITGINQQHMATFGSQENIIKAKYELIESLPSDGTAFFNGNNEYCRKMYNKTDIKKAYFGENTDSADKENVAGAFAVARELGMTEEEIKKASEHLEETFKLKEGKGGLKILDFSYSANPTGVVSHLEFLKKQEGKRIMVMPCLIELGAWSKEAHRSIGRGIGEFCDLAVITTKDWLKEIREGAAEKGMDEDKVLFMEDSYEILKVIREAGKNSVVLLEGRVPKKLIELLRK